MVNDDPTRPKLARGTDNHLDRAAAAAGQTAPITVQVIARLQVKRSSEQFDPVVTDPDDGDDAVPECSIDDTPTKKIDLSSSP